MSSNPAGNGGVPKSMFDANTILYATTDNTPAALTVGEQTVVGRATGGAIAALAIDSDLSSTSANDDTVPSAKAVKTVTDGKANYHGIQAAGALSFDDSTHVLTIASGTNTYWIAGVQYTTSSAITCDIDSFATLTANTLYYFYFDDASGTLKCSTSAYNLRTQVSVATVFWNGSAGFICSELHSYKRNIEWQIWAHSTIGARYGSGLALTNPTTVNDALLQIESGTIYDEDLVVNISQQTTMRGIYKVSASVFTWANYSLPYLGTSGDPQWLDTDDYTLKSVDNSKFVNYWVYATNDTVRPIHIYPTHAADPFTTISAARDETPPVLSGYNLNPEYKLCYRFTFRGDGEFQEYADYRLSSPLPSGGASAVTATSVNFAPTGNIAATNVQAALQELDTEKAGFPGSGIAVSTGSAWGTSLTAPTGALVGTTATQTLDNKTLTSPSVIGSIAASGNAAIAFTATTYSSANAFTYPYYSMMRYRGTQASPASTQADDYCGGLNFYGTYASTTSAAVVGFVSATIASYNGENPRGKIGFAVGNGANDIAYIVTCQMGSTGVAFPQYGAGTLSTDASGNVSASSDERLKTSIAPLQAGLAHALAITPITYKWRPETGLESSAEYIGFSAQNVREVLPGAVGESVDGTLSLNTTSLLAMAINAVKDLKAEVDELRKELKLPPKSYPVPVPNYSKVIKSNPPKR